MKNSELPIKLFYCLLFLTVMNCSKSNDNKISIVGTWTLSSATYECYNDPSTKQIITGVCPTPATTAQVCDVIKLNPDHTYSEVEKYLDSSNVLHTSTYDGTYSVNGNQLTVVENGSGSSPLAWSMILAASRLTITKVNIPSGACTITTIVYTR